MKTIILLLLIFIFFHKIYSQSENEFLSVKKIEKMQSKMDNKRINNNKLLKFIKKEDKRRLKLTQKELKKKELIRFYQLRMS